MSEAPKLNRFQFHKVQLKEDFAGAWIARLQ